MFESVTKRRKNPLINAFGWFLLIVVCIVFVFIGFSPNSSFLGQGGAAAEVNGDAISLREYKETLDRFDSRGRGNNDQASRRRNQENALNFLVSRALIVQEAKSLNIMIPDAEVREEILGIEPFYEDGVFSKTRYRTYLRQAGYSDPSQFEDRIRRDLLVRKMSTLIGYAAKDLELVDKLDESIDQAKINVSYVRVNPATIKARVSGTQIDEFLAQNLKKAEDYYNTHKSEYATPEQVRARHILIKAKDTKKESMDAALTKIEKIVKALSVDNFSDMAKKHSEDPGSKVKGGDLGFFPRGRMVPEFEKMAFSAEVNTITEPVKTQYGYHVLLVDEKKPATEQAFDQVKNQIAQKLLQDEAYDSRVSAIKERMKSESSSDLETYLSAEKMKWVDTGYFNITKENIPGVGQSKDFLDVALELGPDKKYASRLVYQGDSAYLLKYKGAKIDASGAANNQMDFFKQLMKQQKANALVQNWTDSLRAKAHVKVNGDLLK